MTAYYNEIDPYAAQWLRNLIDAGHIAPGIVDERSIEDVFPSDLRGFAQCHFFAGIGVWSYALRSAGWSDDRPVWTGSCPCQPFSAAGKGAGFDDERHLWPAWHHLIKECAPGVILGEQVASLDGLGWLDLVQSDLEASGYASGATDLCAAGVGAPHIRQRLWFVAHSNNARLEGRAAVRQRAAQRPIGSRGMAGKLADTNGWHAGAKWEQRSRQYGQQSADGGSCILGDSECIGLRGEGFGADVAAPAGMQGTDGQREWVRLEPRSAGTSGFWADCDWIACRDDKWRPVEPGTFPLAHGATARVGRLRAYGNAINAEAAKAVIAAYMEATP
ncbi:DNA cytosine methyltransferase [Variovorax sp. RT4R15]|uniref:DNA cytosine methyltransferase n=1 Tax=Variovorax sp. RT4R15 TaxID=3443737 RepID=UPI003F4861D9